MDPGVLREFETGIEVVQHLVVIDGLGMFGLPDEIGCDRVGGAIDGIGEGERASESAVIVVSHPYAGSDDDEEGKNGTLEEDCGTRPVFSEDDPVQENGGDGETEQQAFIGPGKAEERDAGRQQQTVVHAGGFHEAREGAEDQGSAQCGDEGSAGVGVYPVAEETETQHGENSAEQRPAGREPGLQHPADGCAHERTAEEDGEPRISEEGFPHSEEQPLPGEIHRHVRGLQGDVEAFEMGPHSRGGVSQAAMGEGVGREQEAEVVWNEGQRNGNDGKNSQAQEECGDANRGNRKMLPAGQTAKRAFDAGKPTGAETWPGKGNCDRNRREAAFDQH